MTDASSSLDHLTILSRLLLSPPDSYELTWDDTAGATQSHHDNNNVVSFPTRNPDRLLALANSHHVIVRALEAFCRLPAVVQRPGMLEWVSNNLARERARIGNALSFLQSICATLEEKGCPAIVIKSLDHWPDLGSDLDLFSGAQPEDVLQVMAREFKAELAPRSWGDRLANKWNFIIPGLPELVEVHIGRLGQTGEQVAIANRLSAHAIPAQIGSYSFRIPAAEDRILISTLQRMYRHFYLRLCDVIDTAQLLESGAVEYGILRRRAEEAGLWDGVAAYLVVISDYVAGYRGYRIELPEMVVGAARFGGNKVRFERGFLRIPIAPYAMGFYAAELATLARSGEFEGTLRLSLLPCLATAAAIEQKLTGSDKGIW